MGIYQHHWTHRLVAMLLLNEASHVIMEGKGWHQLSRSGSPARLVHIVWRLSWQDGLGDCPRLSSLSSCVAVKTRQSKGTGKQRNPSPAGSIWRILAIFCNDWDVLVSHCVYVWIVQFYRHHWRLLLCFSILALPIPSPTSIMPCDCPIKLEQRASTWSALATTFFLFRVSTPSSSPSLPCSTRCTMVDALEVT